ncbi:MAG: hypothetical protein DRP02_02150 [Candidatus Gerdarchaeota archaeon]|nr:MAG: hypothetical protein DRO63_02885 [Candidatus Gerdarchaeota archaeon]RLI72338.1 MAG: hypothetical protein DRP02_02150 [Candidatus Gerdarchaeota archaeon]
MTSSIKRIRLIIKQSAYWKKRFIGLRIGLYIAGVVLAFGFSMVIGLFNIFYFFLDILKIAFFYLIFMATAYFIVSDKETYDNWHDRSYRNKDLQGKLILSVIEGVLFLIISTAILGLFYLSGFPYEYEQSSFPGDPSTSPLRFIPSPLEGILFAFIIVLQVVVLFTSIYWYYSRCFKVIGFNKYKKIIKIDYRFLIALFINVLIWGLLTVFLDNAYFNFIYPDAYPNFHFLDGSIFSTQPFLYLLVQLGLLVTINLFYIIDGILANKRRTNFIEIESFTTVD